MDSAVGFRGLIYFGGNTGELWATRFAVYLRSGATLLSAGIDALADAKAAHGGNGEGYQWFDDRNSSPDHNDLIVELRFERIRSSWRDLLGGLIHEYDRAAVRSSSGFLTPTTRIEVEDSERPVGTRAGLGTLGPR